MTKERMYDVVTILIVIIFISLSIYSYGQTTSVKNDSIKLEAFTLKEVNNFHYINWLAQSSIPEYYFILERSINGGDFEFVKCLKGYVSPPAAPLLYSVKLVADTTNSVRYKLKAFKTEYAYYEGERCLVINGEKENLFEMLDHSMVCIKRKDDKLSYVK
ncbi:MAG: hypothetical protein J0L87_14000 [Bacteroidetes bacterium]|nr:hypothetical protein [Bacteroidota bacterium]